MRPSYIKERAQTRLVGLFLLPAGFKCMDAGSKRFSRMARDFPECLVGVYNKTAATAWIFEDMAAAQGEVK